MMPKEGDKKPGCTNPDENLEPYKGSIRVTAVLKDKGKVVTEKDALRPTDPDPSFEKYLKEREKQAQLNPVEENKQ